VAEKFNIKNLEKKVRELLNLKKAPSSVTVLDLAGEELRLLQAAKRGSRMRISRYEEAKLEVPPMAKDKELGELLGKKLKELKCHPGGVAFGVPRSEVMLRQMMIPFVENEGEAASMVHFQIARDLPFRSEDAVIDFSIQVAKEQARATDSSEAPEAEKKPEKQLQITVAVVPVMVVNRYKEICKAAGLKLSALGFQSDARAESLRYCGVVPKDFSETLMLLSVTEDTVILDVVRGDNLVFSREASLKESGLDQKDKKQEKERIEQITTETVRCLHSYEQEDLQGQISKIYVMNMGAETPQVLDSLRARTQAAGIGIEEFNPAEHLQLKNKENLDTLSLTSMVGLAAGILEKDHLSIDFLNPKKPTMPHTGKTRQAVLAVVVVIMLFGMFFMIRSHVLKTRMAELAVVQEEVNSLSKNQNLWRQNIIQALSLRAWKSGELHWLDHLAVLSTLLPESQDLYVASFSTGARSNIVLSVRATRSDIIAKLDAQLRDAGYRLKTPAITPVSGRSGYGFQTSMELLLSPGAKPDLETLSMAPERPQDDISLMSAQQRREMNQKAAQAGEAQSSQQQQQRRNPGRAQQQTGRGGR
jgi:Tfp pilus assembly PilM family ATPase